MLYFCVANVIVHALVVGILECCALGTKVESFEAIPRSQWLCCGGSVGSTDSILPFPYQMFSFRSSSLISKQGFPSCFSSFRLLLSIMSTACLATSQREGFCRLLVLIHHGASEGLIFWDFSRELIISKDRGCTCLLCFGSPSLPYRPPLRLTSEGTFWDSRFVDGIRAPWVCSTSGSHYNYPNQLASMIQTAPRRDWLYYVGIHRTGFSLPVTFLADHHCASALFAGFVSMKFALGRQIISYLFWQICLIFFLVSIH